MSECTKNCENCTGGISTGEFLKTTADKIFATYEDNVGVNRNDRHNLPSRSEVLGVLGQLIELVFPGFTERGAESTDSLYSTTQDMVCKVYMSLRDMLVRAYQFSCRIEKADCSDCCERAETAAKKLLESLPELREIIKTDIQAAFAGDPAAKSYDEVVTSYPSIKAVTIQRLAHCLYMEKVPLIPRMMGEYAHQITGIDIHPGATIGRGFFIDHGTGVVIGETCEIGNDVKLYQGVTLGALSFPKDACGMIIKGAKRHPTIQDGVTIYAGATILGAIVIGRNSVIGGNVWLTDGVEEGSKVTIAAPELTINKRRHN